MVKQALIWGADDMDMQIHKAQMIDHARRVLERGGTVEVLLGGQRIAVEGVQSRRGSALIEAKLEGGRILLFDANDPFAIIANG
ncbi:MAG: hypothetical protein WAO77_10925 [Sphingobium sp.]|uniref:hypothetical protein n=1 Tax=Sphingobium sp. TaxID=1912891 RepID=UPI003BAEB202